MNFTFLQRIEQHIIAMSEDVNKVKEPLAALMEVRDSPSGYALRCLLIDLQKDLKPLKQRRGLYGSSDPVKFHSYSAQARMLQLGKEERWAYSSLARLTSLARAMGYLVCLVFFMEVITVS